MGAAVPSVLLVWDRIGDYHAARFRALEKISGSHVLIADLGRKDNLYGWENPLQNHKGYISLSEKPVEQPDFLNRIRAFTCLLRSRNIRVVGLAGYGRPEYLAFLLICKVLNIKVILFAESWYGNKKVPNFLKGKFLAHTCHGFLVSGLKAKEHFEKKLGLNPEKIRTGYSVVDNDHFAEQANPGGNTMLLCVARFSPEKNLLRSIRAFKKSELAAEWTLKLVGGGPQKQELEQEIGDFPGIVLSNWLPYSDLPSLFRQAGFFILPSIFEPWGLVINEAMAAGLPIAVSREVGAGPDLAGECNGFLFEASDEDSIRNCLNQIGQLSPDQRNEMGDKSKSLISEFTPPIWAERFLELANK
jgi:glycosyltransferase involved in cell wall biosynthesis